VRPPTKACSASPDTLHGGLERSFGVPVLIEFDASASLRVPRDITSFRQGKVPLADDAKRARPIPIPRESGESIPAHTEAVEKIYEV